MPLNRSTCLALILILAVVAPVLAACRDGKAKDATFPHLNGVRVSVKTSDQPFAYVTSVAALSALGEDVHTALEEVDYERNRKLWDDAFGDAVRSAESSLDEADPDAGTGFIDSSLIELAAAASTHAASDGAFLSADQVERLENVVDKVLAGRLPLDKPADPSIVRASTTTAALIHRTAMSLGYRQREVQRYLGGIEDKLVEARIECSPDAWRSRDSLTAVERIRAGFGLPCKPEAIRAAWHAIVRDLEEADFDDGLTNPQQDLLSVAVVVSEGVPGAFTEGDRERVQAVIDKVLPQLPSDAYVWLYTYTLSGWQPRTRYRFELTEAASAVLVHTASHGAIPELEIHR